MSGDMADFIVGDIAEDLGDWDPASLPEDDEDYDDDTPATDMPPTPRRAAR